MLAIKPNSFAGAFIALVLLTLTMDRASSAQGANSQTPQELLHAMIGQKLLMRHFGDSPGRKGKEERPDKF